jgi:glycosyltransferase involved in cell wall biosynthesis
MRVTHIITRLIVGGAQENTIASVLGLQRYYHVDARLVSGPTSGPEGSLEKTLAGSPVPFELIQELVRPVNPWLDWLAWRRLVRLIRSQQPDIVHTHSGKAGILGRLAARRAGVPVIVHTIHGPSFGQFQGTAANSVFRAAERRAAAATTHFVSVSDAMTHQYLAAGIGTAGQYTRIFSGFDLQPFLMARNEPGLRARYGLQANDFVIGKIARLFRLKGHDDLFDAAPQIVARCPQARFLLVGDGAWRGRFEARARALKLEKHFIFTGLVSPAEVAPLVGIMDAVVHLSRREGLPRALPQALAAGKPIVAYDCDGAGEICLDNETGLLVEPGNLPDLVGRVVALAQDPELRNRFGRRGQLLVSKWFSVEKMVSDLYALYERLLSRRRSV